jgi:hypothetical protein
MLALGLGILVFGVGVGKLITPLVLQGPVKQAFYFAALQFLPRAMRDWLLVGAGAALAALAMIMLNRSLVDAFARRDRGDLAGIWQRHLEPDQAAPAELESGRPGAIDSQAADEPSNQRDGAE